MIAPSSAAAVGRRASLIYLSLVSIRATTDMPGTQAARIGLAGIDPDPHRDALRDLDEIAGRIVGAKHREFGSGRGRQAFDTPPEPRPAQRIDGKGCRLADLHLPGLRFLEIGRHPEGPRHQEHQLACRP